MRKLNLAVLSAVCVLLLAILIVVVSILGEIQNAQGSGHRTVSQIEKTVNSHNTELKQTLGVVNSENVKLNQMFAVECELIRSDPALAVPSTCPK